MTKPVRKGWAGAGEPVKILGEDGTVYETRADNVLQALQPCAELNEPIVRPTRLLKPSQPTKVSETNAPPQSGESQCRPSSSSSRPRSGASRVSSPGNQEEQRTPSKPSRRASQQDAKAQQDDDLQDDRPPSKSSRRRDSESEQRAPSKPSRRDRASPSSNDVLGDFLEDNPVAPKQSRREERAAPKDDILDDFLDNNHAPPKPSRRDRSDAKPNNDASESRAPSKSSRRGDSESDVLGDFLGDKAQKPPRRRDSPPSDVLGDFLLDHHAMPKPERIEITPPRRSGSKTSARDNGAGIGWTAADRRALRAKAESDVLGGHSGQSTMRSQRSDSKQSSMRWDDDDATQQNPEPRRPVRKPSSWDPLKKMIEMGFDEVLARNALQAAAGNVEVAIRYASTEGSCPLWSWESEPGVFVAFDTGVHKLLQQAMDDGAHLCTYKIQGVSYTANMDKLLQRNNNSSNLRRIRQPQV